MTRSELCTVLTAGMGTIASTVLALYVGFLHREFPSIAGHLISASVISAPAAIIMSKLVVPEIERPKTLPTRRCTPNPTPAEALGPTSPNGNSHSPCISVDGRYVAFVSWADNLVQTDTNERPDIFVYDRLSEKMVRASVSSDGTQSDGFSAVPRVSAGGRWVAFASEAKSLVPGDRDWAFDVFVHDLQTGQTERIDVSPGGSRDGRSSGSPSISGDGRYVALSSVAGNGARPWHVYAYCCVVRLSIQ